MFCTYTHFEAGKDFSKEIQTQRSFLQKISTGLVNQWMAQGPLGHRNFLQEVAWSPEGHPPAAANGVSESLTLKGIRKMKHVES